MSCAVAVEAKLTAGRATPWRNGVTTYPLTAEPPSLAGALQRREIRRSPATGERPVGTPGTVAGASGAGGAVVVVATGIDGGGVGGAAAAAAAAAAGALPGPGAGVGVGADDDTFGVVTEGAGLPVVVVVGVGGAEGRTPFPDRLPASWMDGLTPLQLRDCCAAPRGPRQTGWPRRCRSPPGLRRRSGPTRTRAARHSG